MGEVKKNRRSFGCDSVPASNPNVDEPNLVNTDPQLISGIRRLDAHRILGCQQILARVLDIEDPGYSLSRRK